MTFVPPEPSEFVWHNFPAGGTPVNAADLNQASAMSAADTRTVAAAYDTFADGRFIRQGQLRNYGAVTFMSLGDSLTANAQNPHEFGGGQIDEQAWQFWAQLLSGGKLRWTGSSALGGTTSGQVISWCLPGILGATVKPDFCTVLVGVNDIIASDKHATNPSPWLPLGTSDFGWENIASICTQLLAAGITPVLCTIPGCGNNGSGTDADPWAPTAIIRLNRYIRRFAEQLKVPLADFFAACADPTVVLGADAQSGTWQADYLNQAANDAIHPGGIGALAMGYELVKALSAVNTDLTTTLAFWNNDQQNLLTGGLMSTNASPGPQPDGWTLLGAGTGATHSLVTDAAIKGKWWRVQKTVNDLTRVTQTVQLGTAGLYTPGNILRLSGLLKVNAIGDATSNFTLRLLDNHGLDMLGPNVVPQSPQQVSAAQQTTLGMFLSLSRSADGGQLGPSVPASGPTVQGPFVLEGVMNSGLGGGANVSLRIDFTGASLDVQLAQLHLEVFTATGIP